MSASTARPQQQPMIIEGAFVASASSLAVLSPYDGRTVGLIAEGGAEEATQAVAAASRAMRAPLVAFERAAILDETARLLSERHEEAVRLICAEAGKPLKAARIEVERAATTLRFSAGVARSLAGEVVPMEASAAGLGKLGFTLRVPVGVVGAIAPFNFPLNLVAHKVGPALAAGCATVLKPASATPLSSLLLGRLMMEAGLPPGWLNVVCGSAAAIGEVFVEDDRAEV